MSLLAEDPMPLVVASENAVPVKDMSLTLLASSNISELVETIRACRSVETIEVKCSNSQVPQPSWNSDNVRLFFETIGSLPNLKKIQFKFLGWGDHDNMMPLSLFTAMLNQPQCQRQLEALVFTLVGPIHATENDLPNFASSLKKNQNLKEFHMSSCYFSHAWLSGDVAVASIDPLILALAKLPALRTVSLKAASIGHMGRFAPESIGALCESTTLQTLSLDNFILGKIHTTYLANAIAGRSTLKDLYINLSTVKDLDPELLPASLTTNQHLRRLQLRLANQKTLDSFLVNAAQALHRNTVLVEFAVHGGGIKVNEAIEKSFAAMLECNCTLERLVLPYSASSRPQIDMLLQFNARGRRRFLKQSDSVSRCEWIDLFANNSRDINSVYYYLHVSPLLCDARAS